MELVARAQASGQLRSDAAGADIPLITVMLGAIIDVTHDMRPDAWRRFLAIVIDGLRAEPGAATPLPVEPLALDDVQRAMAAPRGRRR
jgi:hypothetical protein